MQATEMKVVSRSQTTFQGKGSGTMPMHRLCRDPPELGGGGGDNCVPHPHVTRQPPAHNYWCCTSCGKEGHDSFDTEFLAFMKPYCSSLLHAIAGATRMVRLCTHACANYLYWVCADDAIIYSINY